ncbi:hypothetical protein ACPCJU_25285 [Streptomyces thermodiastaticus]
MHAMVKGLLAGAAGTLVLDVVTYGHMLVRGRSPSGLPAQVAERLAVGAGVPLGGSTETRDNRAQAVGALLGYATGVVTGTVYGLLHRRRPPLPVLVGGPLLGAAAMAGSDAPAITLRLTDPTSWDVTSWVSDVVPHLAYADHRRGVPVTRLTARPPHRADTDTSGARGLIRAPAGNAYFLGQSHPVPRRGG